MKLAIVDGERRTAERGCSAACPVCGAPMLAKCGERRVWHWAHKGRRFCDPWWENETEWHRDWKNLFPVEWQEYVHHAPDGERHIADVRTPEGWILEFQHSAIHPEERRSREAFYRSLIWVVDGLRRKRDQKQVMEAWQDAVSIGGILGLRRLSLHDCAALEPWADSAAAVFIDFGESERLWHVLGRRERMSAYVLPVSRAGFVDWVREPASERSVQLRKLGEAVHSAISFFESSSPATRQQNHRMLLPTTRRRFRF